MRGINQLIKKKKNDGQKKFMNWLSDSVPVEQVCREPTAQACVNVVPEAQGLGTTDTASGAGVEFLQNGKLNWVQRANLLPKIVTRRRCY